MLAINDWALKPSALAGAATGKISDVAGLIAGPLWLAAMIGLIGAGLPGPVARRLAYGRGTLAGSVLAIGGAFVACKLSPRIADAVAHVLAAVTTPLGFAMPRIVADPSDLLALPALAVAWWAGQDDLRRVPLGAMRLARRWRRQRQQQRLAMPLRTAVGSDAWVRCGAPAPSVDELLAAIADDAPARIEAALETLAGP